LQATPGHRIVCSNGSAFRQIDFAMSKEADVCNGTFIGPLLQYLGLVKYSEQKYKGNDTNFKAVLI
jgi:hypothetical protein